MTKDQAIAHFGTQVALARALEIEPPSVNEWGKYPPILRQIQLEAITRGALKAEANCLPKAARSAAAHTTRSRLIVKRR